MKYEHKVFPWLQTFITRKLMKWNSIFFSKCNTISYFYNTSVHFNVCSFVARRTSNRLSISLHVFSNMSSVIVAKASVILVFKFVISGTGVENTLSLTYRHKKKLRGVISGDRGGQGVGPSLPIHLFGSLASKSQMLQMLQQTHDIKFWKLT